MERDPGQLAEYQRRIRAARYQAPSKRRPRRRGGSGAGFQGAGKSRLLYGVHGVLKWEARFFPREGSVCREATSRATRSSCCGGRKMPFQCSAAKCHQRLKADEKLAGDGEVPEVQRGDAGARRAGRPCRRRRARRRRSPRGQHKPAVAGPAHRHGWRICSTRRSRRARAGANAALPGVRDADRRGGGAVRALRLRHAHGDEAPDVSAPAKGRRKASGGRRSGRGASCRRVWRSCRLRGVGRVHLLGVLVWWAVAYYLDIQLGLIAWAVGGLAGAGMMLGYGHETRCRASPRR